LKSLTKTSLINSGSAIVKIGEFPLKTLLVLNYKLDVLLKHFSFKINFYTRKLFHIFYTIPTLTMALV
jgi:hypothetical protein